MDVIEKRIVATFGSGQGRPLDIDYSKEVKPVYLIFHVGEDFEPAAKTRKREIEAQNLGHVFIYRYQDLWEINGFMVNALKKIKEKGWGKTIEMCIFSHGGTDGSVGDKKTSEYNLAEQSGQGIWDEKQMTLEGWKAIDFNFDPQNSIAVFYGCKSITFAEAFLDLHPALQYTAAHGGGSADSENYDEMNASWFTFDKEDIYYVSPTAEDGNLAPMEIIKKGREKWFRSIDNDSIFTSLTIDKEGNLIGKGEGGVITIKKNEIKWAKYGN